MPVEPRSLKELFLAALAVTPAERASWLERECRQDAELRQRVELMLDAHDTPQSLLDRMAPAAERPEGVTGAFADVGTTCASTTEAEKAGAVIAGRYKLVEEIGEGGMGTVWMAQQIEPVKRLVAVKLIKAGMDSKQVLARFEAERQALALMDHPNIARVLDAGTTTTGRPFFVMELVKGMPLTRYCDKHRLTPRQRLELFMPVCQAIQHAHQKGIIHRDVKPSNVLICLYDDKPVPKVIDFGIAKAAGQQLTEKTLVTGFGTVVGTLEYMSPEQAELNQLDIDTRSDIYSLGVLLYELLTGTTPLQKKRLKEAAMLEVLRLIREEEPPRPSTRLSESKESLPSISAKRQTEPARLTKLVRGELDWIVMKALEKDRKRRYETANGFALDVQRYLADEPVLACPPSAGYRLRKFVRRNRAAVLASSALVFMLLSTLGLALYSNAQINHALADRTQALDDRTQALSERTTAFNQLELEQNKTAAALSRETELLNQEKGLKQAVTDSLAQESLALYSYRIALAYREWEAGHVARTEFLLDECPPPMREWEWHYLKRMCHEDLRTFRAQDGVLWVGWPGDGDRVVTFGYSHLLESWDPGSGRGTSHEASSYPLWSPKDRIHFGPGGQSALIDGKTLLIHDALSGKEVRRIALGENQTPQTILAVSPNGQRIATICSTKIPPSAKEPLRFEWGVHVHDISTGKELFRILPSPATGQLGEVAFSAESNQLYYTDGDRLVLRDASTGIEKTRWPHRHTRSIVMLKVGARGNCLVTFDSGGRLRVWDPGVGNLLWESQPSSSPNAIAFHPGERFFATSHGDGTVRIWNAQTGQEWRVIRGHTGVVTQLAFRPDGNRLASATFNGQLKIWDTTALADRAPPGALVNPGPFSPTSMMRVSLSSDGRRLAAANGALAIWDTGTREKVLSLKSERNPLCEVALSPDGGRFATLNPEAYRTWVHDAQTGKPLMKSDWNLRNMVFSPDGHLLASGFSNATSRLWDSATGKEVKILKGAGGRWCFNPAGTRLVAVSVYTELPIPADKDLAMACAWDTDTGAVVWKTSARGHSSAIAFSRDGSRLAVAPTDRSVRILDAETGEERLILREHGRNVIGLAFHPSGKRLAALTQAGSVILWNLDTGREALTIPGSPISQSDLVFSPDGRKLYRGTAEGYVEVLDATPWTKPTEQKP